MCLAVELDVEFAQILSSRCPEAYVMRADASTTYARLQALGIDQVDVVISGLPIPSLPQWVNQQVFNCIQEVASGSVFSQLTVMSWVYLSLYRRHLIVVKLPQVKKGFVLLPKRGVVECSFAWAARFRRLARDHERLPETLAGLHFLAFAMVILKQAVHLTTHSVQTACDVLALVCRVW